MPDLILTQGDVQPRLELQCVNADGTIPDLTGADVECRVMRADRTQQASVTNATLVNARGGYVAHGWLAAETARPGRLLVQFRKKGATVAQSWPTDRYLDVQVNASLTPPALSDVPVPAPPTPPPVLGFVDTVNGAGVALSAIDASRLNWGTQMYVIEKLSTYQIQIGQNYAVDHNNYETALGLANGQWVKGVGAGSSLPAGTELVKVVGGVGTLAAAHVDYASPSWVEQRLPAIRAIVSTLTKAKVFDCTNVSLDFQVQTPATGTGLAQADASTDGGAIQIKSGAVRNGVQVLHARDYTAASPPILVPNMKNRPWAIVMKLSQRTPLGASTSAGCVYASLYNPSVPSEARLTLSGGVSLTNFALQIVGIAQAQSFVDTLQAVDTSGNPHNVAIVFDGTAFWLVYDDVKNPHSLTDLSNLASVPATDLRIFATNGTSLDVNREFAFSEFAIITQTP